MVELSSLMHLGDLAFTIPAAAAIGAALLGAGARTAAVYWCLSFTAAMLVVGLNKIGYLSWGRGVAALNFKALSGHAAGASAVFPMLCYLCFQRARVVPCASRMPPRGRGAIGAGIALGAIVAALLVTAGEHSAAEAIAGWGVGVLASLYAIGHAEPTPGGRLLPCLAWAALAFLAAHWLIRSVHVGYLMIKAARILSGNRSLHMLTLE